MYEYKMVQVPPSISVAETSPSGNEAAIYLEATVNEAAAAGWEFLRVDSIGLNVKPGPLGSLGANPGHQIRYVITFRRAT
jgi:hypothetical protein